MYEVLPRPKGGCFGAYEEPGPGMMAIKYGVPAPGVDISTPGTTTPGTSNESGFGAIGTLVAFTVGGVIALYLLLKK